MAVRHAHVFPGFLTPVPTQLSFQSHQLLFSHALVEVRGENTPERKFTTTGYRTWDHQVTSLTCSPLSHPDGATNFRLFHTESYQHLQKMFFILPKFNPLPDMPLYGSSTSAAKKKKNNYDVRNMDKWGYSYLIELKTL